VFTTASCRLREGFFCFAMMGYIQPGYIQSGYIHPAVIHLTVIHPAIALHIVEGFDG